MIVHHTLYRLVIRGFRTALKTSDLWLLRKTETTAYNRELFGPRWEAVMRKWRQEQAAAEVERKQMEEGLEATGAGSVKRTDTSSNPQMTKSGSASGSLDSRSNNSEKEEEEKKQEPPRPPLFAMLWRVYGLQFLFGQLLMLIYVFVYFINPCLLWYVEIYWSEIFLKLLHYICV